ncbi:cyclase family protein [Streptomyces sp. W16]|uniref:cyclase family protein n=1 Tax=Streptomyces sp. W16 TaxID=3076631 RepID=UPI00295B7A6A|nr:cyclase family protein [Streptomyces sp. W16]MDV9169722.1 cyclase family protein [Streptomyces sp. W16]
MSQPSTAPAGRTPESRWRTRPDRSTWGDFGPDDVLGRMNLVGPEQVRKGLAEVHDGITFCLSLALDQPGGTVLGPNRYPPVVRPTLRSGVVNFNCDMGVAHPGATDVVNDDLVVLHTQYSTQWDAFGHIGARFDADGDGTPETVYYNGWRADTDVTGPVGAARAGAASLADIEGIAQGTASSSDAGPVDISHLAGHGVQGRAVLVDLEAHYGTTRAAIGYEELAAVLDIDRVTVEAGDILLLHTGFTRNLIDSNGRPRPDATGDCAVLDGSDPRLRAWIRDSGVAAIAADNHAVEAFPDPKAEPGRPVLPLHRLCLFELGIHLGELWWLSDLARHLRRTGRSRCLLTAPPLRLPRATGSPVTPIATV